MALQRASCLAAGGASAPRGLQCLLRGRGERPASHDCPKKQAENDISILSTNDVATDVGSSVEGLSVLEVFGQESAADGLLATLPPLHEVATFHSQAPTTFQEDESLVLAHRARAAHLARQQRRSTRVSFSEAAEEMLRAELSQPMLIRQLAERIRQEAASHQ